MTFTKKMLAAAFALAGLALGLQAQAATGSGGHWSGGGGHSGNWSGHSGGNWNGGHWNGGHWRGGHFHHGPFFSFFVGVPLLWAPWYWGYPYDYYWPNTVIYRDVERVPDTVYDDGPATAVPPTTTVPPGTQGPAQAPAYLNYCASAKAYYPKVTSCPEGWRFQPAR